ncbi:hypothetical protein BD626DRAFT_571157 [Schizophyllum amplum]|uniref:Uncharacterized protein n=1 Tax=Schizophyllum amplum TaxID=97359 RepID=A0A550C8L4_9AGAR|nr:hypothetical protein BD626DRAFT_571157 [Auriculariopsis ampla]
MFAFKPIVAFMSLAAFAAAIRNPDNPQDPSTARPLAAQTSARRRRRCCGDRIRINYGQTEQGHYIWYINDYDPNNLPEGISITTDTVGTC